MIYKDFKGLKLSALGLGCMRFPVIDGVSENIDEKQTAEMFDYAIEHGINYFDTAYMYHGGQSEIVTGKMLKKYPRDSFYLASKFPGFEKELLSKAPEVFEKQLEKCGVDYFDFYLFHNVSEMTVEGFLNKEYGIIDYLLEQKKNGRIKHLGFSTHAELETMQRFYEALNGELEFCQIQLNYLDWKYQDAEKKVEMIKGWGIPVWVMEPLRGGMLAAPSGDILSGVTAIREGVGAPELGLRFIQSIPEVCMTLSGMSNLEQLKENIKTFEEEKSLNEAERADLAAIVDEMLAKNTVPCTGCRYCVSHCPMGLDIPKLISLYNDTMVENELPFGLNRMDKDHLPNCCIGCGSCASVCPQNIPIPEIMSAFAEKIREAASK